MHICFFIVLLECFVKIIYSFILDALGLLCYVWAFSSCGERGCLVAVGGLLILVAFPVAKHGI